MINSSESNQLHNLIQTRHSIRRFLPKPVPKEQIKRILESATWAPSTHNRQPWRFVVLETKETRMRFVEAMSSLFRQDLLADGFPEIEVEKNCLKSKAKDIGRPGCDFDMSGHLIR